MPELAGVSETDVLAVLDDVGNDEDFRVIGQEELFEHVDLQHAETAAEIDLLLRGDLLIAKDHDVVIQVRAVNPREVLIIDRPAQVEANDLGADGTAEGANFENLWRGSCGAFGGSSGGHQSSPTHGALTDALVDQTLTLDCVSVQVVRRADWSAGTQGDDFIAIRIGN
ncbi:hypothetical protein RS3R6_07820 [Pseudomonas atacamensis]|nr:hypothetical protein RS3R6_07820 [Pseudomonas atacamensis]